MHVPPSQCSPAAQHLPLHDGPAGHVPLAAHIGAGPTLLLQRLPSHTATIVSPALGVLPSSARGACMQPSGGQFRHASYIASALGNRDALLAAIAMTTVPQQSAESSSTQSVAFVHARSTIASRLAWHTVGASSAPP